MEVWKKVYGFDVLYEVSNHGRVRTKYIRSGKGGVIYGEKYRVLTPYDNGHGYLYFKWKSGKKKKSAYVHRLVANAFVENPNGYTEINHLDENKQNNAANNLEWTTHKLNCQHGTRNDRIALKTRKAVICIETNKKYKSSKEAAKYNRILISALNNCLKGRAKTSGGYHWRYAD